MLLECSCSARHPPPAGGAVLQVRPAVPAHDVAAVAVVKLVSCTELMVANRAFWVPGVVVLILVDE